ncbi:hypothetical protein CEUSTIGMA_g12315.t1 [Chlamydomonas eustigma]|uniref:PB1 domain-containing protein n=1 Tax=Chlamydomonas eustigma TaxID=1157962 RepID=A0A250XP84_9CHLO|nr:hypothetical protein CEUSTIGMA_g12315.t1 [Chlamydomonas eustigma]|eukprot:GAX84894.1 hypothetical protein CEUSTIGMA_g12315.t1 [Chlamydomonas eustigma]
MHPDKKGRGRPPSNKPPKAQTPLPSTCSPSSSTAWPSSSKVFSQGWTHPKSAALHQIMKPDQHVTDSKDDNYGFKHVGLAVADNEQSASLGAFKGLKRKWLEDHSKQRQGAVVKGGDNESKELVKLMDPLKSEKKEKMSLKEKRRALIMEDDDFQVLPENVQGSEAVGAKVGSDPQQKDAAAAAAAAAAVVVTKLEGGVSTSEHLQEGLGSNKEELVVELRASAVEIAGRMIDLDVNVDRQTDAITTLPPSQAGVPSEAPPSNMEAFLGIASAVTDLSKVPATTPAITAPGTLPPTTAPASTPITAASAAAPSLQLSSSEPPGTTTLKRVSVRPKLAPTPQPTPLLGDLEDCLFTPLLSITPVLNAPVENDIPTKASKFLGPEGAAAAAAAAAASSSEGLARVGSKQALELAESIERKKRLNPIPDEPSFKRGTASKLSSKPDPQSPSKPHTLHTSDSANPLHTKSNLTAESSDGTPAGDATASTPMANVASSSRIMPSDADKGVKQVVTDFLQCGPSDGKLAVQGKKIQANTNSPVKGGSQKTDSVSQDAKMSKAGAVATGSSGQVVRRTSDAADTENNARVSRGDEPSELPGGRKAEDRRADISKLSSGQKGMPQRSEPGRDTTGVSKLVGMTVDSLSGKGAVSGEVSGRGHPEAAIRDDKKQGKKQRVDSFKEQQPLQLKVLAAGEKPDATLEVRDKSVKTSVKEKKGSEGPDSHRTGGEDYGRTIPVAARSSHADDREVIMVECLVDASGGTQAPDGAVSSSLSRVTEHVDMGRLSSFKELWSHLSACLPTGCMPDRLDAKLMYLDKEGDWLLVTPDEHWGAFVKRVNKLLVSST